MPAAVKRCESASDFSTERVPISTGRPWRLQFAASVSRWRRTWPLRSGTRESGYCLRIIGRLVGTAHDPAAVDPASSRKVLDQRAAHAAKAFVRAEITLEGNLRGMIGGEVDRHAFFGFDRLMQSFAPVAIGHRPAGAFIDDDDLILHDHVVMIAHESDDGRESPARLASKSLSIACECSPTGGLA